jgi:CheY-like chemotaxis protein
MRQNKLSKIMCVEDEPDIQAVAQLALADVGGFDVCIVGSGAEALARATDYAPDLILLDVMMPSMDGPSTLQAMRRIPSLAHTPIVFMTAKVQAHEIEEYKGLGAAGTIPKPFDPMTLADQVRRIWDDLEQLQH